MILAIVIKTSLVLAVALGLAKLLQKRGRSTELVWLSAIIASLAIPFVAVALPVWRVPLLPYAVPAVKPKLPVAEVAAPVSLAVEKVAEIKVKKPFSPVSHVVVEPAATAPLVAKVSPILVVWLFGVAAVEGRIGFGLFRLLSLRKNSDVVELCEFAFDGEDVAEKSGFQGKLELRRSRANAPSGPLTWGLIRPIVLLPRSSVTWSQDRLKIVLLHELTHVRRRDGIFAFLAECACAIHWFNPLAWIAARALREESERAADVAVVQSGVSAAVYAQELLQAAIDFKYQVRPRNLPGAQAMTSPKLETRLRAILSSPTTSTRRPGRSLLLLAVFSAVAVPAIAAFQAVPKSDPERDAALQHAKALALATLMYSQDYDSYFPNAKSDAAAWNRVRPYLKGHLPVEAPKSKSNFHFNKKVSKVSSSQIPHPAETPVWFETLQDKSIPFAVAYADGHAKLVTPSGRRKFIKELRENFSDQQGLHIKLNPSEAKFLAVRDGVIRQYKQVKSHPNKIDPAVRANVIKKYIELRRMDEMKANTFQLQNKARLQILDSQKQLKLKQQLLTAFSQLNSIDNDKVGKGKLDDIQFVWGDQLQQLNLSKSRMSKDMADKIAKSLDQALKANNQLSTDQLRAAQDEIAKAKQQMKNDDVRIAIEEAMAELKKQEAEIRALQEQLKAQQDKDSAKLKQS